MKIFIGAHFDFASTPRNKFRKSLISNLFIYSRYFYPSGHK